MRVLSHWAYVHQYGYHYDPDYTDWAKTHTLDDWLASDYSARTANNLMTRFLNDRLDDNLMRAMAHLEQVDVIGFLDDWDGLQTLADYVLEYIDRDKVRVDGWYNASDDPMRLSRLRPATLAQIQERNQKDIVLYERAREIMQARQGVRV